MPITANPTSVGFWSPTFQEETTITWSTGNPLILAKVFRFVDGANETQLDGGPNGALGNTKNDTDLGLGHTYRYELRRMRDNVVIGSVVVSTFELKTCYWAYDFACDQPIEAIPAAFNTAGPWQWQLRDSDFYGDYLNCRPKQHVRLRVHEYPSKGHVKFVGLRYKGFKALLQIDAERMATRSEIDDVFRRLLQGINATNVTEIEPYDC